MLLPLAVIVACSACASSTPDVEAPDRPGPVAKSSSVAAAMAPGADPLGAELVDIEAADLRMILQRPSAKAVLVNVWATWCEPCVAEMPAVLQVSREYRPRGVETVLISSDFSTQRTAAREFLRESGVDFTTYFKTGDEMAFIEAVSPEWSGALPATFVFGPEGQLQFYKEGQIGYGDLKEVLELMLSEEGSR